MALLAAVAVAYAATQKGFHANLGAATVDDVASLVVVNLNSDLAATVVAATVVESAPAIAVPVAVAGANYSNWSTSMSNWRSSLC